MADSSINAKNTSLSRVIIRISTFVACVVLLLAALSRLFVPSFGLEGNGLRGMYQQRNNVIQVGCVGASSTAWGFSPMWLYSQYGISSYNACSGNQPSVASYYLLRDMIESQKNSLSVVIIDAMPLVTGTNRFNTFAWGEQVVENMPLSINKVGLLREMANTYKNYGFFQHLIPLLSYHNRWCELKSEDYEKAFSIRVDERLHGQHYHAALFTSNVSLGKSNSFNDSNIYSITDTLDSSPSELRDLWNPSSNTYIRQMIQLCKDQNIEVLLLKTPASNWTDQMHDSIELFADEAKVDFLDMNDPLIWEDCDLSFNNDYRDAKHVNLRGSLKTTDYLGKYLVEHYTFKQVNNLDTVFTESELRNFDFMVDSSQLLYCNDLMSYTQKLDQERYTVFVAAGMHASEMLTDEARAALRSLGLTELADIKTGQTYVGALSNRRCIAQKTASDGNLASLTGTYDNGVARIAEGKMQPGASFDHPLSLSAKNGNVSIRVDGKRISEGVEGISFVVYDEELGVLVDTSSFDMRATPNRVSDQEPVAQEG